MSDIKVLAFDVFGTVVDWFGSISREFDALPLTAEQRPITGSEFALAWRDGYQPAMSRVRRGEMGWTKIDDLHRMILDDVLQRFRIGPLTEYQKRDLNKAWHRLTPWPDARLGLYRLKTRYTISTLSNGNIGLLTNMAKNADLPWDVILSAEVFKHYKPAPQTYLGVCEVFDIKPEQMMLVAAHKDDLAAAKACGCRTAFIERPEEFGPRGNKDLSRDARFDFHARSFHDLADQLSCPA